jgi:energy-coupling factor transporter transmembrane protein EcfT
MTDDKPTRRDLMKPLQLLGLAFGAAVFAGIVTLIAMGFFQQRGPEQAPAALQLALIFAGVTFIVVLLSVSLLLLAIDPAQVTKTIDRPVLQPRENPDTAAGGTRSDGADPDAAASGGTHI